MWSMRQEYIPRYKVQRKVKKCNLQSFFVKKTPLSPSFAISRRIFGWFLFLFCFLQ